MSQKGLLGLVKEFRKVFLQKQMGLSRVQSNSAKQFDCLFSIIVKQNIFNRKKTITSSKGGKQN